MNAACALHPDRVAASVCARCGNFTCTECNPGGQGQCPTCVGLGVTTPAVPLPWDSRESMGLVSAFWAQTKLGILEPRKYIASIAPQGAAMPAFLYGWLMSTAVGVLSVPYNAFNFWSQGAQVKQTFSSLGSSMASMQFVADLYSWLAEHPFLAAGGLAAYSVVFYPVGFLMGVGLTHVGLLAVGGRNHPIGTTMRVFGYAQAPNLLLAIPVVGGFAGIYTLVVSIWALREVQQTTTVRASVAVLWPTVAFMCLAMTAGIALAVTLAAGIKG